MSLYFLWWTLLILSFSDWSFLVHWLGSGHRSKWGNARLQTVLYQSLAYQQWQLILMLMLMLIVMLSWSLLILSFSESDSSFLVHWLGSGHRSKWGNARLQTVLYQSLAYQQWQLILMLMLMLIVMLSWSLLILSFSESDSSFFFIFVLIIFLWHINQVSKRHPHSPESHQPNLNKHFTVPFSCTI